MRHSAKARWNGPWPMPSICRSSTRASGLRNNNATCAGVSRPFPTTDRLGLRRSRKIIAAHSIALVGPRVASISAIHAALCASVERRSRRAVTVGADGGRHRKPDRREADRARGRDRTDRRCRAHAGDKTPTSCAAKTAKRPAPCRERRDRPWPRPRRDWGKSVPQAMATVAKPKQPRQQYVAFFCS